MRHSDKCCYAECCGAHLSVHKNIFLIRLIFMFPLSIDRQSKGATTSVIMTQSKQTVFILYSSLLIFHYSYNVLMSVILLDAIL
jgi:hypothetical protein